MCVLSAFYARAIVDSNPRLLLIAPFFSMCFIYAAKLEVDTERDQFKNSVTHTRSNGDCAGAKGKFK